MLLKFHKSYKKVFPPRPTFIDYTFNKFKKQFGIRLSIENLQVSKLFNF